MKHLLIATAVAATATVAHGAGWDEATSGDLSNDRANPTFVSMAVGSNPISGTTGRSSAGIVDRDYFNFTLAAGSQLDAIVLRPGTAFLGPSQLGFIAVQAGNQVTVDPEGGGPEPLLGWHLYYEQDLNQDILPSIGQGLGAIGFSGPLLAGTYTFWIQETTVGFAPYFFDFQVSGVPEASTALVMLAGLAGIGAPLLRRKR
ncbi:MAG: hypothetical protein ABIN96_14455 [Rubrivivax sp.]